MPAIDDLLVHIVIHEAAVKELVFFVLSDASDDRVFNLKSVKMGVMGC